MSNDRSTGDSAGASGQVEPSLGRRLPRWCVRSSLVILLAAVALFGAVIYAHSVPAQHVAAGSIAQSGLLTSSSIPDATTPSTTATLPATVQLSAVDWSSLGYLVDCGGQTAGTAVAYPTPGPDTQLAVVFVSCVAGAGNPPSAVLVYDNTSSTDRVHLRQTLLTYQDNWMPKPGGTSVTGPNLAINVYGYSSDKVPRCCPDLDTTLTWTWNGSEYLATNRAPSHRELPKPGS